ncbi:ABC transporter substrate-binding protein [Proteiniclasticum ruminis]|uniref:ABC-type Fe3+ transport system, substrate-binding protein n=1 Tax=Proteiniclasticum ruminis TaxID=398199 RepID=A0A1I4Y9B8_9CLOT|nr:ABC transporter substrate-binding protein [Proteiniclasticum ruminis]SFN34130.1 ABC-type Fe3+ transport system, substrate-binding protein [Proteiniclasticum ruminis]
MAKKYIDHRMSLYTVTEEIEGALALLLSLGFTNLNDEKQRALFGKVITISDALKTKGISLDAFTEMLGERETEEDQSTRIKVKMAGVLPCPVRVPLLENFEEWLSERDFPFHLDYDLKAASMGIGWLSESLENKSGEELPDLFISAGFDMFFDKSRFGRFREENFFEDLTSFSGLHRDFDQEDIRLKDPRKQYSMIGVVPAVFLVNTKELGNRKVPRSWDDILSDEFKNSISLPVSDFDLFNAILLNIYKSHGEAGIAQLGRNMQKSMHPAEMVKSHMKLMERPSVTIMPYFFTKMVKDGGPMVAVWPEDGAIISPIFLLTKKERKKELQPIVDYLLSKEVGELLSHNGRFPSVNPEVDNRISEENRYQWIGWEFIEKYDLTLLIRRCEEIFQKAMRGEVE